MSLATTLKHHSLLIITVLIVLILGFPRLMTYLKNKGRGGELMTSGGSSSKGGAASGYPSGSEMSRVSPNQATNPFASNDVLSTATPISGYSTPGTGTSQYNSENPANLLPADSNASWADYHPSGQGELNNINTFPAGFQIGIDSVGSSLRNANQQIRSEPPNPRTPVSIWNQSTITQNTMQPPLEFGQGPQ